jgi:hypothetical protein
MSARSAAWKQRPCTPSAAAARSTSFTTVYDAPSGFEENAPYTVALVKLEEGPLVTAQLTDLDERPIEIGTPVEMVTRRLRTDGDERGMIVYGYKFSFQPCRLCFKHLIQSFFR